MAKQDKPKECPDKERINKLIDAGRKFASRVIDIEKDPDLISVFSIARAHGYTVTSRFWHGELKEFVDLLNEYDSKRKNSDDPIAFPVPVDPAPAGGK